MHTFQLIVGWTLSGVSALILILAAITPLYTKGNQDGPQDRR